jgi:hypothetical protein
MMHTSRSVQRRRRLLALLPLATTLLASPIGHTQTTPGGGPVPPELASAWPAMPRIQGEARLRFLGLHIYDIRLWTPGPTVGNDSWATGALALEIAYARALAGRLIAERSLKEMQRAGPIATGVAERWLQAMTQIFPDVQAGDRITGLYRPERDARFFHNGNERGTVSDPEFARRFFGIWLAESTSEPSLRQRLLGRS